MTERSLTPNITVTIGHHTRIYFAFVTTAPAELDSPATVTLHARAVCGRGRLRRRTTHRRRHSRPGTGATGPRRCDGARLATSTVPRQPASAAARGSRARRPQHAAALALATASGPGSQPGRGMTRSVHSSASTARRGGELFRRSHHGHQDRSERQRQPSRQTRGCRAALHRRRARRLEADRVRRVGATQWQWPQRYVPGTSVRRQWRSPQLCAAAPVADAAAQERVRELVLQAYAEYEETATEAAS